MPEGPEVRKYADALDAVLTGRVITSFMARTRNARDWLKDNESRVVGQRVQRVLSHGKHLIGYIDGGFFFQSHLMMWGRWQTFGPTRSAKTKSRRSATELNLPERDRRERARIVVEGGAAILLSAPIFNVGKVIHTTLSRISRLLVLMRCLTTGRLRKTNLNAGCFCRNTSMYR